MSRLLQLLTNIIIVLTISIQGIQVVRSQENAQTRIPESLEECYKNVDIYERDNRLPATVNTLIELIRKIEDAPDYTQDIRQVAVGLLHRFRMDGIKHAAGNVNPSVLPFSPSEYQFSKHRLLLSRLIPGNAHVCIWLLSQITWYFHNIVLLNEIDRQLLATSVFVIFLLRSLSID